MMQADTYYHTADSRIKTVRYVCSLARPDCMGTCSHQFIAVSQHNHRHTVGSHHVWLAAELLASARNASKATPQSLPKSMVGEVRSSPAPRARRSLRSFTEVHRDGSCLWRREICQASTSRYCVSVPSHSLEPIESIRQFFQSTTYFCCQFHLPLSR